MKLFVAFIIVFGLSHGQENEEILGLGCKRNDPELVKCLVNLYNFARPLLKNGGKLFGRKLPKLNSIKVPSIPIDISRLGLSLYGVATDILIVGVTETEIIKFQIDSVKDSVDITVQIPKLHVSALYDVMVTKMIFFKFQTAGRFTGVFYNVTVNIKAIGYIDMPSGGNNEYLRIDFLDLDFSVGPDTMFNLENTSGGFRATIGTKLVNCANKEVLINLIKPSLKRIGSVQIKDLLNQVFDGVPLSLFLE